MKPCFTQDVWSSQADFACSTFVWSPDNIHNPALEWRLEIPATEQSGVEATEIVKTTRKQILPCSGIVLEGMRKSCLGVQPCTACSRAFDRLSAKESQDFLMLRLWSSQQIDLQQGTVYSLEASWPEGGKRVGWERSLRNRPLMISGASRTWQGKT